MKIWHVITCEPVDNVKPHEYWTCKTGLLCLTRIMRRHILRSVKLRRKGKKRKNKKVKVLQLKNRPFIEQRPAVIEQKGRYSDWEGDFIVSGKDGKGALLVLKERKAQYTVLRKMMLRSPVVINQYIKEITGGFACFNSLTVDNDISFRRHEELSSLIGAPVYFCHPYHAWEKGSVENTNSLIRQYIW